MLTTTLSHVAWVGVSPVSLDSREARETDIREIATYEQAAAINPRIDK